MKRRGRPRGTGHPIKPESERLPESATVRFRTDQIDFLCREALRRGLSLGAYIRAQLFPVTKGNSAIESGRNIGGD